MGTSQLIAGIKDAHVTREALCGLPRRLDLPRGIAKHLHLVGVLAVASRTNDGTVWTEGPKYSQFMRCWK
jgi:hypothetical protein